ncbi:MAG: LUD domain-containing protein [Firmicutes bacterium]|jgi:iron-sulfur cluster protein|nr:LUD domain-containing protein [Bacillota bacterium]
MERSERLAEKVKAGLLDRDSRRGRRVALDVIVPKHIEKAKQYPALSRRLREVKAYSIANLDALVEQAIASLEAVGCKVFYAKTGEEAVEYIKTVIPSGVVVKSKSNAGKEIGLVEALEARGVTVIETDLGDRIVQLAGAHPSHSLVPALHIPIDKIAQLFTKEMGCEVLPDLDQIIAAARRGLLDYMLRADYGLSGANAIAADCGAIFLIENEGNIRAVTNLPHTHVVIAGIEKIVPTPQDALTVVQAASVYGLGQDLGTYVSCISGPSRTGDVEYKVALGMHGPKEVHVVLMDNGRRQAIRDGYGELLYCTNCGSCLNFCPVYGAIGEHYGHKYLGGRGIAFTAYHAGLGTAQDEGLSFCTTCESCKQVCPAGIDAPRLVAKLRRHACSKGEGFSTYDEIKSTVDRYGNPYAEQRVGYKYRKPRADAVVFVGCVASFREREAAEASLALLDRVGVDFTTIDEHCCGGVYEDIGHDPNPAFVRANHDAIVAAGAHRIVFLCPRCERFFKDTPAFNAFELLNIAELLAKMDLPVTTSKKVTYHDPCHLGRSQGCFDAPREVLRRITPDFVEPLRAGKYSRCCGAGSVVRGVYPRLSLDMSRTRIAELASEEPDVILTECPACLHNLKNAKKSTDEFEIYNISEFIEKLFSEKG